MWKKVTGVHIPLKISGNHLLYNIFTFGGKQTIKTLNKNANYYRLLNAKMKLWLKRDDVLNKNNKQLNF